MNTKKTIDKVYDEFVRENYDDGVESDCGYPAVRDEFMAYAAKQGIMIAPEDCFDIMLALENDALTSP